MRDMMPAVPRIKTSALGQTDNSNLRVTKRSLEIRWRKRLQQQHPTLVKRFQQRKRHFDWGSANVAKLGPTVFVVSLDRWFVFGERELEPTIAVQVTIGHVVHDLPNSPAAWSIRRLELLRS